MPDNERRGTRGTWGESEAGSGDGAVRVGGLHLTAAWSVCLLQQSRVVLDGPTASNSAIFPQVPVACAGRVLGADFCPNLEEPDQRLEVQVGVLLFYQSGVL